MVKVKAFKKTESPKIKTNKVKKKITSDNTKSAKIATAIKNNKDVILASTLPSKKSKFVPSLESKSKESKIDKKSSRRSWAELASSPSKLVPSSNGNIKEIKPNKKTSKTQDKLRKDKHTTNDNDEVRNNLQTKFNIRLEDVLTAIEGLLKLRKENPKLKKQLLADDRAPLFLQICCHKLPKGYSKILRIPLRNSLITPEDEICLIVSEIPGIGNKDHEKHIEHYEELLKKKGVTSIKTIMTCHQLRTEYETFEQKSRLVDLYDLFLVNGKVSGKVVNMCGKIFYKKRKVPIPVKLQATNLKGHIDTTLRKVPLFLHLKGDSFSVQFGHTDMSVEAMLQNICDLLQYLDQHFPGGFKNVKGIHAFGPMAGSIPIYMSFEAPKDLPRPTLKPKKPKAYEAVTGELTTLPNVVVTVTPTGRVLVRRTKLDGENEISDNIITDEDLIDPGNYVMNSDNEEQEENVKEASNKKKGKKRKATESAKNLVDDVTDHGTNQGSKKKKIAKEKISKKTKPGIKVKPKTTEAIGNKVKKEMKMNKGKADDISNKENKSNKTDKLSKKPKHKLEKTGGSGLNSAKKLKVKGGLKTKSKK